MVTIPDSVEWVEVGGEAVTEATLGAVRGRPLFTAYGPTEVSIVSAGRTVTASRIASIGRPMPNVTGYVVAAESSTLHPIGVWGELLLGGVQVARAGHTKRIG